MAEKNAAQEIQFSAERAAWSARWLTGFGLTIFTGFRHPTAKQIDQFKASGVKAVIVGLNHQDDDRDGITKEDLSDVFRPIGGKKARRRIHHTLDMCQERGIEVWPMIWARTARAYNETARAWLKDVLTHPACGPVVHDCEVYWHRLLPPGMDHAEAVAAHWAPAWADCPTGNIITDYAYAPASIVPLLEHSLGVIPQAYSRASWISRGSVYRAGKTQEVALKSWQHHLADTQVIILGLAAYDQSGHPGGIQGGMRAQWRASQAAHGVAWWSWPSAGRVARRTILALGGELLAGEQASSAPISKTSA